MNQLELLLALQRRGIRGPWRHGNELLLGMPPDRPKLPARLKAVIARLKPGLLPMLRTTAQDGVVPAMAADGQLYLSIGKRRP